MNRNDILTRIHDNSGDHLDIIIIGGGATGAGIALDATSRGFRTLLLEQEDFGKGTSGRSTKLIHGGVRYLAQGNISLVLEALLERGHLLKNAPHITSDQNFLVPVYSLWEVLKYTTGLKLYDLLSGRLSLGKSRFIKRQEVIRMMPNLNARGLKGGVIYHDGQFDDTRLLISLIRSASEKGCLCLNYFKVTGLLKNASGKLKGVKAMDLVSAKNYDFEARLIINATGVFADDIIRMDTNLLQRTIRPSQGVHIVLDKKFLPGKNALMIPKTEDGRVLFVIPWYNHLVAGTTDTPVNVISLEPRALEQEINFILRTAGKYLIRSPHREDILTVFAGLRPLVASANDPEATRELSRSHRIRISESQLITVEGGKWTTYRRMAQDALDKAASKGLIEKRRCITHKLQIDSEENMDTSDRLHIYGKRFKEIMQSDPVNHTAIHPLLPYTKAEIIWICRNEMPVKLEDVMSRRTRALLLNAKASLEMSPAVAGIMAEELGLDEEWVKNQIEEYRVLVKNYVV